MSQLVQPSLESPSASVGTGRSKNRTDMELHIQLNRLYLDLHKTTSHRAQNIYIYI